jgi:hypothetical protein
VIPLVKQTTKLESDTTNGLYIFGLAASVQGGEQPKSFETMEADLILSANSICMRLQPTCVHARLPPSTLNRQEAVTTGAHKQLSSRSNARAIWKIGAFAILEQT